MGIRKRGLTHVFDVLLELPRSVESEPIRVPFRPVESGSFALWYMVHTAMHLSEVLSGKRSYDVRREVVLFPTGSGWNRGCQKGDVAASISPNNLKKGVHS